MSEIIEVHQRIPSPEACTRCAALGGYSRNLVPHPHDDCKCTRNSFYAKVSLVAETEVAMLPPSTQEVRLGINVPGSCFEHQIITSVKGETGWQIGLKAGGFSGELTGGESGTVTKGTKTTYCYSGNCNGAAEDTYAIYDITTYIVEKLYLAMPTFSAPGAEITWMEVSYRDEITLNTLDVRCN